MAFEVAPCAPHSLQPCQPWAWGAAPTGLQGDTLALAVLFHSSAGAGTMGWCQDKPLCPSWDGHAWGSPAPGPGGPSGQWVLSISRPCWQRVLSRSGASPASVPASVDSRGHILARAPCQPLAPAHCLPSPAASVEPTLPLLCRVPPAWALPAPHSGMWVSGASDSLVPGSASRSRAGASGRARFRHPLVWGTQAG